MKNELHEGDMAEELAEREYYNITGRELIDIAKANVEGPVEYDKVLGIAREALRQQWLLRATEGPEEVRTIYNREIGRDGFPGPEVSS